VVSLKIRAIAPVTTELEKSIKAIAKLVFICGGGFFQSLSGPAEQPTTVGEVFPRAAKEARDESRYWAYAAPPSTCDGAEDSPGAALAQTRCIT